MSLVILSADHARTRNNSRGKGIWGGASRSRAPF